MNVRVVIAGVFAVLLVAGPALAQPGRTPVSAPQAYAPPMGVPQQTYTKRYGSSIALADAASAAAVLVGAVIVIGSAFADCEYECEDDSPSGLGVVLMIGGAAGYVFGGPLIHSSQGNSSGAGKSLGLRLGLPLVGALAGAALGGDCGEYECNDDDDYGPQLFTLGLASAMVIDWVWLAKKEVRMNLPVTPYATPMRGGGMSVGLGGTF